MEGQSDILAPQVATLVSVERPSGELGREAVVLPSASTEVEKGKASKGKRGKDSKPKASKSRSLLPPSGPSSGSLRTGPTASSVVVGAGSSSIARSHYSERDTTASLDLPDLVSREIKKALAPGGQLIQSLLAGLGQPTGSASTNLMSVPPLPTAEERTRDWVDGHSFRGPSESRTLTGTGPKAVPMDTSGSQPEGDSEGSDPGAKEAATSSALPGLMSQQAKVMLGCMHLAQQRAPELVSTTSGSAGREQQFSSATALLQPHLQAETSNKLMFSPASDLRKHIDAAFATLKGLDGEPTTELEPPAGGKPRVPRLASRDCMGRRFVAGGAVPSRPLPNDLPQHMTVSGRSGSIPSATRARLETLETFSREVLNIYSIQESLIGLLYRTTLKPVDGVHHFQGDVSPGEMVTVLRGMQEANASLRNLASSAFASSVLWTRQEVLDRSQVTDPLKAALASAPYSSHGLFGRSASLASEVFKEQTMSSAFLTIAAQKRGASSSRGGRHASATATSAPGPSQSQQRANVPLTRGQLKRKHSRSRGGPPAKVSRGAHNKGGHPQ